MWRAGRGRFLCRWRIGPGHAQVDFGEADGYIGGKKIRFHYFYLDIPHSDACFVKSYPTEDTEVFLDGYLAAFAFLGGVPQSILHDSNRVAMAKILSDDERRQTQAFSELQSYYFFNDKFGPPAKGNDKGKVEGLVDCKPASLHSDISGGRQL